MRHVVSFSLLAGIWLVIFIFSLNVGCEVPQDCITLGSIIGKAAMATLMCAVLLIPGLNFIVVATMLWDNISWWSLLVALFTSSAAFGILNDWRA